MEMYEIKIYDTEPFGDDPISSVYAELPNGVKAWFCHLADTQVTSFTPTVYFDLTPLYGENNIKVIDRRTVEEYYRNYERNFAYVCGNVVSIKDFEDKWYDIELECLGIIFYLNIYKKSVPNIEVGCYLELEVSAAIGIE